MDRELLATCHALYARVTGQTGAMRLNYPRAWALANYPYGDTHWETLDALDDDAARAVYMCIVAKHEGAAIAADYWKNYCRIHDPRGVTIRVSSSDDDPFAITFIVQDDIANAWAEAHGSIAGGTWECPDEDPSFVYDCAFWYPGIWEKLAEYDLDFSEWSDPDEDEIAIAQHARECPVCDGDYRTAEEHVAAPLFPPRCSRR